MRPEKKFLVEEARITLKAQNSSFLQTTKA